MNRIVASIQVLGLSLAVVTAGCTASVNPENGRAFIENLGGKVTVDKKSPDHPVIFVDLSGTKLTDAGLERLEELTQLQRLDLAYTRVTDAGLKRSKS